MILTADPSVLLRKKYNDLGDQNHESRHYPCQIGLDIHKKGSNRNVRSAA